MIDFYALTSPNVQKIFIMLEECEVPYNIHLVDVWNGEQFTPEFTKINPLQKIPAIVDSDGPAGAPYTVIESGAILIYLAEKTGKFIPHDAVKLRHGPMADGADGQCRAYVWPARAFLQIRAGRRRLRQQALPHPGQQAVRPLRAALDRAALRRRQRLYHRRHCPLRLRNAGLLAIDLGKRPHVKAWVDKAETREAVKHAYKKIGKITSARDTASEDAKDRFFGRGRHAIA